MLSQVYQDGKQQYMRLTVPLRGLAYCVSYQLVASWWIVPRDSKIDCLNVLNASVVIGKAITEAKGHELKLYEALKLLLVCFFNLLM